MKEVNKTEKGELCLIGPNIALGSYNDMKKALKVLYKSKNKTHIDLIYKTGDIVYEKNDLLWF